MMMAASVRQCWLKSKIMKTVGYIVTTVVLAIYSMSMNGWALSKLWAWFVVTTLSMPPLTIPAAIGLAIIVKFFQPIIKRDKEKEWAEVLTEGAVIATISPITSVGIGWLVKLFM